MKQFIKRNIDKIIILVILLIFCIIYAFISISSHNHFETFGWDLGFFDQIIWKASRGDLVALSTLNFENLLADHFQPVLYILSPLYLIKSDVRMILIAQAFLVVIASYPLYLLAKEKSRNIIFSFSIVISYLFFMGTQWLILNEFHQMAFLPLILIIALYSLHKKNLPGYWISIVGLLFIKEEVALLISALGLIVLSKYKWKKEGLITIFVGIFSFFFLIYLFMPYLSVKGEYSHMGFGDAGFTPKDVIQKSVTNPAFFLNSMLYPTVKIKTVFETFFAFGFLPILSPIYLLPVMENFITRFIYAGPQFTKWINVNQHAAPLGILMAVGSIYSAKLLVEYGYKKLRFDKKIAWIILGIYMFCVAILQDIILHGPINSIFKNQLFMTSEWMKDNYSVINRVPSGVSVAAQNSMLPHVSHREKIYLLPQFFNADFILVDLHDGQNKYSPLSYQEMKNFIQEILITKKYSIYYQKGQALLLKKSDFASQPLE